MHTTNNTKLERNPYSSILSGPHQVSLDITNKCNLRCLHCYNSSGENALINDELSDDEVISFIEDVASLKPYGFCFCGGETLLRSDLIVKSLSILKNAEVSAALVSNGILLTDSILARFYNNGLRSIQFSMDGTRAAHDKMRGKSGAFDAVLNALRLALEYEDLRVSIAYCPTQFNIDTFEDLYSTVCDVYLKSKQHISKPDLTLELRVQPLMLLGRARLNKYIRPTEIQYRYLVNKIHYLQEYGSTNGIKIQWGDPIDHMLRYANATMIMDQMTVRSNGDLVVSPYIPLVVGNIRKHSFTDYWNAGLCDTWCSNIVSKFSSHMYSIDTMEEVCEEISDVAMGGELRYDIIDGCDLNNVEPLGQYSCLLEERCIGAMYHQW